LVRDAFAARGWEAWSCDLLESERPSLFHYQGDVRDLLTESWDLMVGHPPCTALTNSANRHLYTGKTKAENIALGYVRNEERWTEQAEGAAFFNMLWNADVPHIALENPVMNGRAAKLVGGVADQFVQPYQFGTPESKATGLRLKNLPPLVPHADAAKVEAYGRTLPAKVFQRVHHLPPSPTRWKERSRTFPGLAQAMADQWGPLLEAKASAAGFNSAARVRVTA
jgi:hypothetical protein